MGLNMAKNLIKAGYHLQVHNRTMDKINELDAASVTPCPTPADAAKDVQIVITMLSEDSVVTEMATGPDGILKTLPKGAIHISMSTIAPDTSNALAKAHEEAGSHYLTSPVFGRPEAAAAAKLRICISGSDEVKEKAKEVLQHLGHEIFDFGTAIGSANVVKIAGNFMIQASIEMMSEAYTLAEKFGIDRTQVADFFGSTLFAAPIFQSYGKGIAAKQYEPVGFKTTLGYKDARLAFQLAQQSETPMPLGTLVHNRMLTAVAKGRGDRDWMEAISRGVTDDAGV